MPYVNLTLQSLVPLPMGAATANAYRGRKALLRFRKYLDAVMSHTKNVEAWTMTNDETARAVAHRAGGFFFSGTTGTQSAVVGGTSVDVTYATSAANTNALMVAAINADATVKQVVQAHGRVAKLTTASAIAGDTVTVFGVKFTAQSAAATAGTEQWDIRTSDTAAGLSLATQINSHPLLANKCFAANAAGVIYLALFENRYARREEVITSTGGTVTINNQIPQGATWTLTCVSAIAGDTVTVGGVVFTGVNGAVTLGEATFDIRTSDTACARSLADQINAYGPLKNSVKADSAIGVVTIQQIDGDPRVILPIATGGTITPAAVKDMTVGVAIFTHLPGVLGNYLSYTVSGTNATKATLGTNLMGGGSGFDAASEIISSWMK